MFTSIRRLTLGVLLLATHSLGSNYHYPSDSYHSPIKKCEEITIPMCRGIGYNQTAYPNDFYHETQEEAGLEVHQFWPLVEIKCSPDLKFFLCSMYTPICLPDYHKPVPACRGVCERARKGCAPIMQQYNFEWPEKFNCEALPLPNQEQLCMEQPNHVEEGDDQTTPAPTSPTRSAPKKPKCTKKNQKNCVRDPVENARECDCKCRAPLIPLGPDSPWFNTSVGTIRNTIQNVPNCGIPCRTPFFSLEEQDFAGLWIALWSALCIISTLMTLTTFFIDTDRFKYPERPIVFLSACYFMVSLGYLTRFFIGHEEIACDGDYIKYSSTGRTSCTLVFLLVYFFGMSACIWWVVLSLTWFLAAGLKWGNEAIAKHSQYFHLAAWLIPTVQSVLVILKPGVDGDPVAGICYVGNTSVENLKNYVLAPLFVYLVIGTTFLLAGFVSLFRIRSVIKQQGGIGAGSKADKLEKLMIRIGIFSVLYTVPAVLIIGCNLYEATYQEEWMTRLACPCAATPRTKTLNSAPMYSVLMLKYFMTLAVGITSGVWIWSGKTLDSWRRFWGRCCGTPMPDERAQALIKGNRAPIPQPYAGSAISHHPQQAGSTAATSLLATPYGQTIGSVASNSHHHLHHHMLKPTMSTTLSHV